MVADEDAVLLFVWRGTPGTRAGMTSGSVGRSDGTSASSGVCVRRSSSVASTCYLSVVHVACWCREKASFSGGGSLLKPGATRSCPGVCAPPRGDPPARTARKAVREPVEGRRDGPADPLTARRGHMYCVFLAQSFCLPCVNKRTRGVPRFSHSLKHVGVRQRNAILNGAAFPQVRSRRGNTAGQLPRRDPWRTVALSYRRSGRGTGGGAGASSSR